MSLYDLTISLISVPSVEREDVEIDAIIPWIRRTSDLLRSLEKDALKDVMRNCVRQTVKRDDIIIKQGERGDSFYVVLGGWLSVYMDTTLPGEEARTANAILDPVQILLREIDELQRKRKNEAPKKKKLNRSEFGKLSQHYGAGKRFGIEGLISDDLTQKMTVIADEVSELLVIRQEVFNRTLKRRLELEYQERKEFIKTCPLFADWASKFKRVLEMCLRKETYDFGSVILQQGEPANGLVFILRGEVKIHVEPGLHQKQFPNILPGPGNKHREVSNIQDQVQVRRQDGYAAAEKRLMVKRLDLCSVEGTEILGDIETVLNLQCNVFTATCGAKSEAFVLDLKDYERLSTKKSHGATNFLLNSVRAKLVSRLRSSKGVTLPLVEILISKLGPERIIRNRKAETSNNPVPKSIAESNRNAALNNLIQLFMYNKIPFISPCVPDAVLVRKKALNREIRQRNEAANAVQERALTRERPKTSERPQTRARSAACVRRLTQPPKKHARSVRQLKVSEAEKDLLEQFKPMERKAKGKSQRPWTTGRTQTSKHQSTENRKRPLTAQYTYIISECNTGYDELADLDSGQFSWMTEADAELFEELDQVHRMKINTRSRVASTMDATRQLKALAEENDSGFHIADDKLSFLDNEVYDWETSNENLKCIEEKVHKFYSKTMEHKGATVSNMKRFNIREVDTVPLQGGTVFVRRKPCAATHVLHDPAKRSRDMDLHKADHRHIRRYMVSKQPTFVLEKNKINHLL